MEDVGRYGPPQNHAVVLDTVKREHRFVEPRTLLRDALTHVNVRTDDIGPR